MSRAIFDRSAADWRKVADAAHAAGASDISLPALHMSLILHGYEQMRKERAAALALLAKWDEMGLVDNRASDAMRHALGELSDEQYAERLRAASAYHSPSGQFFVDTTREGCVDHLPTSNASCIECARVQGVTL